MGGRLPDNSTPENPLGFRNKIRSLALPNLMLIELNDNFYLYLLNLST
jgi:hypothetical protein